LDVSLNVLVVGTGSIGERQLRCFQRQPEVQVALCESFAERRHAVADRYRVENSFASIEEAVAHPWDAAVICTPAHLHVDQALQLLPKTAALLIEKPLAVDLAAARRLLDAARGRTVGVAYVMRAHPAVQAVRQRLADGELGRPLQITIVTGEHFPTFRPAYRDIYYSRRETGGGAIQDAATHMFDLAQHLVGRLDWVFCDAAHQALLDVDVEDTVHFIARAGGGKVMISLALNQFMAPNETVVQVNCDKASARMHLHEHRHAFMPHGETNWQWSPPLLVERDEWFERQAASFLEAVAGRTAVLCPLDDAFHTLQVNLAALKSAAERTPATIR
jgi:predicted dehydrogenase